MNNFEQAIEKLNKMETRYKELTEKLSDAGIINNQKLYKELSKEFSYLEPIMENFKKYNESIKQKNESEELLTSEKDPEIINMAKEEINTLNIGIEKLEEALKKQLIPPVKNADKNIIMEIRAGTGGDEAALFSGDLFKMYTRYAEKKNWKVEIITSSDTGLGGYKEIIFMISGKNVYDNMRFEYGGHRVQRIPTTESQGRVHTSAVTVAVMPEMEDTDIEIKPDEIRIDVFRAGGSGGQHVNKTESAVRITHNPTGIVVQCQDSPSQHLNKNTAMKVLRSRLYDYYEEQKMKERSNMRKEQVGSGDRSQKVRTYNFPQNRVTDHRINMTLYKLDIFMTGEIEEMIEALKINDAEERMKLS
ncbi:MAG: peptide chain release factor 1 [Spirochaetes bacterium]|nr:peptide chain release factor 1 [Spirochaetota bacterium]